MIYRCRAKQSRRFLVTPLLSILLAGMVDSQVQSADLEGRPNIILIMADDIGYECFGCYGSKQYRTPNIDALARNGIKFTQCHAQPLCTPTRVKLMTGLSNVRNYSAFSVLNRNQKTIGQYFREAGYRTAIGGKWQLLGAEHYKQQFRGKGSWPAKTGFEHASLWQVDRLGDRYWNPLLYLDGQNRQFKPNDYGPDVITENLMNFMTQHREEPFFIYYPMILVHSPFLRAPEQKPKMKKDPQKNFEAMVHHMDVIVGQFVRHVDRLGIGDRTLVLFVGDNGTHKSIRSQLGDRIIQGGKGTTTDAGTHVPFVASWSGKIPAGTVCSDLVGVGDFLPTLMEVSDLPVPSGLDGRTFWPQLQGQPGVPRQWLHCYYNPRPEKTKPKQFTWDHRFKLYSDGRFYDVLADPDESEPLRNWQKDPTAAAAHGKLKQALASFPNAGQSLLKYSDPAGVRH